MSNYRKKPTVVEAVLYYGNVDTGLLGIMGASFEEGRPQWIDDAQVPYNRDAEKPPTGKWWVVKEGIMIGTLEGHHIASPGDYIIKGIKGELYPVKPDIFKRLHDQIVTQNELINILGLQPDKHNGYDFEERYETHNGVWIDDDNGNFRFEWYVTE
jgi:hypothetical protein